MSRAALVLVAAGQAEIGVWGIAAPRSFFDTYPGLGHHWVSALGSYDEHLVRDFAAAELGFAVLLVCAAVCFEPRLVRVVGTAFMAATVPHFAYHLATTDHLRAADNIASLTAFGLEIAIVACAMVFVSSDRKGAHDAASHAGQPARA